MSSFVQANAVDPSSSTTDGLTFTLVLTLAH